VFTARYGLVPAGYVCLGVPHPTTLPTITDAARGTRMAAEDETDRPTEAATRRLQLGLKV
jgi:hypothetical protein